MCRLSDAQARRLRRHDIEVTTMTGMVMHPLTGKWRLDERDLEVNYLVAGSKGMKG